MTFPLIERQSSSITTSYTNSAIAPVSPNIGDYREDSSGVISVRNGTARTPINQNNTIYARDIMFT